MWYWQWGWHESELLTGRMEWDESKSDISVNHRAQMPSSPLGSKVVIKCSSRVLITVGQGVHIPQCLDWSTLSPSVWIGGTHPQCLDWGYTITSVPPLFEESSQVQLCLFVDFVAFYFTKTHILLKCWQRSFSFWRTSSPRPPTRAVPLDASGGLPTPDPCYIPQPWRQIDSCGAY